LVDDLLLEPWMDWGVAYEYYNDTMPSKAPFLDLKMMGKGGGNEASWWE
jgi:hypothetical protein